MALSRRPGPSRRTRVREFRSGTVHAREDRLATEEPLEIRVTWPGALPRRVAVTMRTPGHDFELATGFLFAEGVVGGAGDLHTVMYCTDNTLSREQEFNVVTVELARPPRTAPAARYDGPGAASSACGVCGAQSIDDVLGMVAAVGPPVHASDAGPDAGQDAPDAGPVADPAADVGTAGPMISPEVVLGLPERLRAAQRVFDSTGGLHAAGLFDADGTALVVREDIGRHNAVDKVVGSRLLAGADPDAAVLAVSGRIGFEIVQKAARAGIGVLVAVGAPSSLAVDLARRAGICAVGFTSAERFVTYSAPERLGV